MWNRIFILAIAGAFVSGCTENKDFDFVLPLNIEPVFFISEQDGSWQESYLVTYDDVADAVDDLEDDIEFQSISIEGVTLIIENQDANLTGVENVNLTLIDDLGNSYAIYTNESISIPPGGDRTEVVVTGLAREGVQALKDLLEGFARNEIFENFTLISTGSSTPQGTPLQMELTVVLHMSFNYTQPLEVPGFIGNE